MYATMGLTATILATIAATLALFALCFVLYMKTVTRYWEKKKIVTLKSKTPLLGHYGQVTVKTASLADITYNLYGQAKDEGLDYAGAYFINQPILFIFNPQLIGEVMVKRFEHFVNRRPMTDQKVDKILGRSLLSLQDEEWREMRHHLSPAFTGSKLKGMVGLVEATCDKFRDYLVKRADKADEPLDMYNAFRRLAADVIATTAFGAPSDAITDAQSEFYNNGIKIMDFSDIRRSLVFFGYMLAPQLMRWLGIPFVPKNLNEFFTKRIVGSIKYREENNKSRADMIQLLIDARRADPTNKIEDIDIVSQAFTFFLGGFDTTATAFSAISHRLALHPEVQTKVRDEIRQVMAKYGGEITYESLKELKYMDMTISEVLRLHPVGAFVDRLCTSNISFPDSKLMIEKGTVVFIPTYGLHTDPDHFPDPWKFDPERFSDENKHNIKSFTYLPFGEGPRNCIGKRFAQMEMKLGLAKILNDFEFVVCEKTDTSNPMNYSKTKLAMQPEGGFWLAVKPLKSK